MKSFLKTVLAVMVGLFAMSVLSMLFFTCSMVASLATSSGSAADKSEPGDVMYLKINGEVTEVPPSMPFTFDMLGGFQMNQDLSLRGYLNAIAIAKQDPNIVGIYLNTDNMTAAPASYEAIHDALVDFRSSGKWIIAYNDNFSLGQYYVASAADSVFVNTIGSITFDGMSTVLMYPKALLDKLNIEMQIFRVGSFKSAVEPYMIEHISEANRLQTETYLRNIWNQMAADIAESRNLPVTWLDSLANQAVSYMQPEELAATRLVDGQVYKSDVEKMILAKTGKKELEGIWAKDLVDSGYETYFPQKEDQKVAVLYAVGEIASEAKSNGQDGIYYEDLIKEITKVADDDDVKALVLRVNSPGGSGFASEQIWKALMDLKARKPLVVSMGDYAASGGYYISCLADYIVAEPNTLTGSIGVFGVIPNFGGLVSGKLGVNFEEVKTHDFGTLTTMRKATEQERVKIQNGINLFYELFTGHCAEGRRMEQDSIKAIAGGRVWTGSDALKIGLVDELGNLDLAVAKAVELANLTGKKYSRVNYPAPKTGMEQFLEMMNETSEDISLRIADRLIGTTPADRSVLRFVENLQHADHVQARSFDAVIY
ncbi:MAG: signal peptide peptidase SppA [Bacteroidales bacterium]|nr:signal peptide peptidase SppA [Bacteroidales bacterium]